MKWSCIKCDKEIPQHQEFCKECEEKQFRKIGGFLFIPLLGLFLSAFYYILAINNTVKYLLINYTTLNVNAKAFFIGSLVIYFFMFLLVILVGSYFLRKKKELPRLYIILLLAVIGTALINLLMLYKLIPGAKIGYDELLPIVRSVLSSFIWIPYFIVSERVKKTFVR